MYLKYLFVKIIRTGKNHMNNMDENIAAPIAVIKNSLWVFDQLKITPNKKNKIKENFKTSNIRIKT
ncbi:hypothetical protein VIBNI_B2018 [Vibrio nigripulchritudo]|uniref:Uncharacterized protein n=1 Tax=Vibrio nigripulchritudo TaxID=28173 RepID=U4K8P6_9VIBR|nr:hypothetical protein VIBNI_B2018 [Vibrio nigripulchritudo]